MKPFAIFSVLFFIAIVVAGSFGLAIAPHPPIVLPDGATPIALFVCPAASNVFDPIARGLGMYRNQLMIAFFFFFILLIMSAGWAFYQNLISDKFDAQKYEFTFFLAKALFWVTVVVTILLHTPNGFRTVGIAGAPGDYVFCQSDTPGARAVKESAIILHSRVPTRVLP
ncbi:MAG: hypothetical protein FWC51_02060 [Proteobacteria bacterium]|nr:hypothetical protein [Pseudomonadota bacterium]